jgi:hypothetical protein
MSSRSHESSSRGDSLADRTLCEAVVTAVADAEGVDPTELTQPLYDAVDPEALDTVFRRSDGWITFEYYGYVITVDAGGTVELSSIDGHDGDISL